MLGKFSRRKALGLIGTVPVGGALAAKAELDATVSSQAGLIKGILAPGGAPIGNAYPQGYSGGDWRKPYLIAAEYAKAVGLPEHVKSNMRERARFVDALDPDLAAKRSWSMSVKIATQRERNYQREVDRIKKDADQYRAALLLKETVGWEWPW